MLSQLAFYKELRPSASRFEIQMVIKREPKIVKLFPLSRSMLNTYSTEDVYTNVKPQCNDVYED